MADGVTIGKGKVEVTADTSGFDKSMDALPQKGAAAIDATERAMEARSQSRSRARDERGRFIGGAGGPNSLLGTQLEAKLQKVGDAGITAGQKISQGSGNAAMGLMMVSQFVDDMQYGFRSVVNNVPSLGMAVGSALGMSGEAALKFGGALGIAAVAVNLLITHWDVLMDAMSLGKVYTEAEAMEKLAAATKLTADEQERLNRYKREKAAGQELSGRQASGVAKTEVEVKSAIAEMGDERMSGREKLIAGLIESRRAAGLGAKMMPDERERLEGWEKEYGGTPYGKFGREREMAKIQERLDKEDNERATKTVDQATFDASRRQGLINEIQGRPSAFPAGAAAALDVKPAKNTKDQEAIDLAKRQSEGIDEDNRRAFDEWKKLKEEANKRESERLANALGSSVGSGILSGDIDGRDELEARVKAALEKAGVSAEKIGDLTAMVATKLAEEANKNIEERALAKGLSYEDAQKQLSKEDAEQKERDAKRGMTKAEVMSNDSYLKKLMVAGVSKPKEEQIASQQLAEQKTGNKWLDQIHRAIAENEKRNQVANFARGRS